MDTAKVDQEVTEVKNPVSTSCLPTTIPGAVIVKNPGNFYVASASAQQQQSCLTTIDQTQLQAMGPHPSQPQQRRLFVAVGGRKPLPGGQGQGKTKPFPRTPSSVYHSSGATLNPGGVKHDVRSGVMSCGVGGVKPDRQKVQLHRVMIPYGDDKKSGDLEGEAQSEMDHSAGPADTSGDIQKDNNSSADPSAGESIVNKGTKFFRHIFSGSYPAPDSLEDDDLRLLVSQNEVSEWKLPFSLHPLDDQLKQQAEEDNAKAKTFYDGPYPDVDNIGR